MIKILFLFWKTVLNLVYHPNTKGKVLWKTTFINLKNFHPMVQTDISQLSAECSEWLQILRNYRQEFHDYERALQDTCKKSLGRQQLLNVEHLHNQFDIQLKNIHDVKQKIKHHERRIEFESSGAENISDDTYSHHEQLLNEFLILENTLQEIRNEFKNFVNTTSC